MFYTTVSFGGLSGFLPIVLMFWSHRTFDAGAGISAMTRGLNP